MSTERAAGAAISRRLPEVRENEAPPAIRAIYDDIKRATGIPQVNLIIRHLACDPAVLTWAWATVAPLYRSGAVAAAAKRLEPAVAPQAGQPIWQALAEARQDEVARVQAVLAFYNRANRSNLIGLTTLLRTGWQSVEAHSRSDALPEQVATAASPSRACDALVPPLPRPDAVAPEIMALIEDLSRRQGSSALGIVPSLYLHLTLWPEVVRAAHEALAPVLGTAAWCGSVDALIAAAEGLADMLAETIAAAPPPEGSDNYLRTIQLFVTGPIPQMVLVGGTLTGGVRPAGR